MQWDEKCLWPVPPGEDTIVLDLALVGDDFFFVCAHLACYFQYTELVREGKVHVALDSQNPCQVVHNFSFRKILHYLWPPRAPVLTHAHIHTQIYTKFQK